VVVVVLERHPAEVAAGRIARRREAPRDVPGPIEPELEIYEHMVLIPYFFVLRQETECFTLSFVATAALLLGVTFYGHNPP
jgi:hypothetical protein